MAWSRLMPFVRILTCCCLALGLASGIAGVCQESEKAKLTKRKEELEDQIKKEEDKIAKKKDAIAAEFKKLAEDGFIGPTGAALDKSIRELRDALRSEKNEESKAALEKQVRAILNDNLGPNLTTMLDAAVAATITDKLKEDGAARGSDCLKAATKFVFSEQSFDAAFENEIKPEISKSLKKLREELGGVLRRLEDLATAEAAKRTGVPPGMLVVKGGTYRIGVNEAEIKVLAEKTQCSKTPVELIETTLATPAHDVKLDDYYLDQNEVTCAWYAAFLKENTHPKITAPKHWKEGKYPEGFANRPVTNIKYTEAQACARWMGRRMPTEEEWEAAARFTEDPKSDLRLWPWGDEWNLKEAYCNNVAAGLLKQRTEMPPELPAVLPGGSFLNGRSKLGFNDMAGNAAEWTSSPFSAYKGFKEKELGGRKYPLGEFDEAKMVVRGGCFKFKEKHCTTFARKGVHPYLRNAEIGFRTAASAARGKDHLQRLREETDLNVWVQEYPPLPSDIAGGRPKFGAIELANPSGYTALMSGGWDQEANLPTAAKFITIASRAADDFTDFTALKSAAREAKDSTCMIGFVHLDFPAVEPALDSGDYFVLWQNAHDSDRVLRDPPSPGHRPDAFVFQRRGTKEKARVEVKEFLSPIVADARPTELIADGATGTIDLLFSFPQKEQMGKAFLVFLRLKLAEGEAARLR